MPLPVTTNRYTYRSPQSGGNRVCACGKHLVVDQILCGARSVGGSLIILLLCQMQAFGGWFGWLHASAVASIDNDATDRWLARQ